MKKIIMGVSILCILGLGVFIGIKNNNLINSASANPDYICKKSLPDSPCMISNYPTSCSPWTADGTRTCPGIKTTEVSYYLVRTECEAGYTKVRNCWMEEQEVCDSWDGSNCSIQKVEVCGDRKGNSGRQGADYVSGSQNCTITESDHVNPAGKIY